MHKLVLLLVTLGCAGALAGCNTADALIPQVDVGGGTFRSPPVNQSDLDSMSRETAYVAPQAVGSVESVPFSSQQSLNQPGQSGTVLFQGASNYTDPAGSLEAQAGQLQQGETLAQQSSQPMPATVAEDGEGSDTAVMENTERLEEPRVKPRLADEAAPLEQAEETRQPQRAGETASAEQAAETAKPQQSAAVSPATSGNSIRFLPIIGAPVEAVTPLSKQLGAEARSHGLTIKSASDASSQHILKGYFSALKEGDKTTVIYVWDVLDGSGNRLHRIQGQDTVDATSADLWSAVPAQTMQTIASETIDAYLDWRRSNPG